MDFCWVAATWRWTTEPAQTETGQQYIFDSIMRKYIPVNSSYICVEKDDDGDPERKEKKCCKSFKKIRKENGSVSGTLDWTAAKNCSEARSKEAEGSLVLWDVRM